jgi:UDP-N-acetylmuramoylalanine--D-glutamate ligase
VVGYGRSGRAAARWLVSRGWQVVVLEDNAAAVSLVAEVAPGGDSGAAFEVAPKPERAAELVLGVDLVVPSPGVPGRHPALVAAREHKVEVWSEIELAWADLATRATATDAGPGPLLVAITGTNGKTTVTELVTAMLVASGLPAVAAGNVGYPLLDAVSALHAHQPGGPRPVLVAEVSSFQLENTRGFRPDVSCWLNFTPDHLDWHPSLDNYASAKAKIWANQLPGSTVVVNTDDPVVMAAAATVPEGAKVVTFGAAPDLASVGPRAVGIGPTWAFGTAGVKGPGGLVIKAADLPRALPHDLANTAAALAVAMGAGASEEGCLLAARTTPAPPHRMQFVAEGHSGVAWYDDSKATTPASVLAGVKGLRSVVLIAGGRNKGLDLGELAKAVPPVRAVVAIGESAPQVEAAFTGVVPVRVATSMAEAVHVAAELSRPGDAVVLSPGCASFDWYSSYAERGEHFAALAKAQIAEVAER